MDNNIKWEENTISLEDKQLHYYYSRSGTNRPFIFLHGAMDNGMCYDRVAEQFTNDYDVYLLDARGHGRSSDFPPDFTFSQFVNDIKDMCEHEHLQDITLMGHSMGGAEAAMFAATYPDLVKAVIMEDPGFMTKSSKAFMGLFGLVFALFLRHEDPPKPLSYYEKRSKKMNASWDERDQLVWAKAQQELATHFPRKLLAMMKSMPEGIDVVSKIHAPALLVTSERGIVKKKFVKRLQEANPGLQWKYVEGAGHNIRREQFQIELDAVKEFLSQVE